MTHTLPLPAQLLRAIPRPFLHALRRDALSPEQHGLLSAALPHLEWEIYVRGSYQYDVSSVDRVCPGYTVAAELLEQFVAPAWVEKLGELFDTPLERCIDATFHRMTSGHFSRRHNDENDRGEKVRLCYYLSDTAEYDGGELALYDGEELHTLEKMPANSIFAFVMTNRSFHEARPITAGTRYNLIITYA